MKKKHRDIIVNKVKYGWIVYNGGYKVFLNKQVIIEKVDHDVSITPKTIRESILQWIGKNGNGTHSYSLSA